MTGRRSNRLARLLDEFRGLMAIHENFGFTFSWSSNQLLGPYYADTEFLRKSPRKIAQEHPRKTEIYIHWSWGYDDRYREWMHVIWVPDSDSSIMADINENVPVDGHIHAIFVVRRYPDGSVASVEIYRQQRGKAIRTIVKEAFERLRRVSSSF